MQISSVHHWIEALQEMKEPETVGSGCHRWFARRIYVGKCPPGVLCCPGSVCCWSCSLLGLRDSWLHAGLTAIQHKWTANAWKKSCSFSGMNVWVWPNTQIILEGKGYDHANGKACLAFEKKAIFLDAYTLVWVLKHETLIYFPFSVKEGCLNLVSCHFGEISDSFIPRMRIFGGLKWEFTVLAQAMIHPDALAGGVHFKLKQCTWMYVRLVSTFQSSDVLQNADLPHELHLTLLLIKHCI